MHYGEDELTLYYYGEGRRRARIERHLETCEACGATYRSLAETLQQAFALEVPARDASYPDEVWQRIARRLPEQERAPRPLWVTWSPALAAAAVLVAVVAFTIGTMWSGRPSTTAAVNQPRGAEAPVRQMAERVRLAAVADHLDRTERVLLDLANADAREQSIDLTAEQQGAADLIDANRLYRDAATHAGDALVAGVLDDLERTLLDVMHGPAKPTMAELAELRARLDAAALLFKVRVLASELRERQGAPIQTRKTT